MTQIVIDKEAWKTNGRNKCGPIMEYLNYKIEFSSSGCIITNIMKKTSEIILNITPEILENLTTETINILDNKDYFGIVTKVGFLGKYKKNYIDFDPETQEIYALVYSIPRSTNIIKYNANNFIWEGNIIKANNIFEVIDKVELILV